MTNKTEPTEENSLILSEVLNAQVKKIKSNKEQELERVLNEIGVRSF